MNAPVRSIIAEDFDRARQEMLAEFRALIKAHPEAAIVEAMVTIEVMGQLLVLEGVVDA